MASVAFLFCLVMLVNDYDESDAGMCYVEVVAGEEMQ
jgi:hypothetical protein